MSNDQQTGAEKALARQTDPPGTTPEPNAVSETAAAEPATVEPGGVAAQPAPNAELETLLTEPSAAEPGPSPVHETPRARSTRESRDLFGVQAFFTVVIFSIFVITFVVQAFQIPSSSMENTLLVGDFLLVDKVHFAGKASPDQVLPYGEIHRGDIVVFYFPVDPTQFLVKRVIGLPGDRIRLRNKTVFVNGMPLKESYAIHRQWIPDIYRDNFPAQMTYARGLDQHWREQLPRDLEGDQVVVPANCYFVMGDNRDDSEDSRYWGFVPRANIIGRPLVIYLSVKENGPGRANDKLQPSGQMAHLLQLARWDRLFRLVR